MTLTRAYGFARAASRTTDGCSFMRDVIGSADAIRESVAATTSSLTRAI
jgi:hypothetical protein